MSNIANNVFSCIKWKKVLDEVEKEEQLTPEQKIKQLTDFIGGFENWSLLNEDCRLHIVQFLDYKSRCQLERCSKQDQATVKSFKISLFDMTIFGNEANPDAPIDYVQVSFRLVETFKINWVRFCLDGEDTECWRSDNTSVIKGSTYYKEAAKFAEEFMNRGRFGVCAIWINAPQYPCENSQMRQMPLCKEAQIWVNSAQQLDFWISKLPEDMNCLNLRPTEIGFIFPFESFDVPQVRKTHNLMVWGKIRCTDEQFLSFTNQSMYFFDIAISDEAINKFIKRWINGNCFEGFEQAHLGSMDGMKVEAVLDGINATHWDDNFNKEASAFYRDFPQCHTNGDLYEVVSKVDPYKSLTLYIFNGDFNIYHTKKRVT